MRQRNRNAQLEAQSRSAFRGVLPVHWAYRNQHEEDVGIDGEVEVFNLNVETQTATASGVLFKVQLRATDEPVLAHALGVRMDTEQVKYFRRLTLPVLLARYHAPTDTFYARWMHLFDVTDAQLEQRTVVLRLTGEDRITEASPEAWLEDMVVVVEPSRFRLTTAPWRSEFSVTFRNISPRPVFDVNYDVTASPDTSVDLGRLRWEPQFDVDPRMNWVPMYMQGVYDSPKRPFQLLKFQRMDPGREYTFVAYYEPVEDETDNTSREVAIRIRSVSAEASPILSQ